MRLALVIHACDTCGAILPPGTHGNKRYCLSCRKIVTRELNRLAQRKHRAQTGSSPKAEGLPKYQLIAGFSQHKAHTGFEPVFQQTQVSKPNTDNKGGSGL